MIDLSKIYTVSQLKAAVTLTGSHFFDADAMRFFRSRVAPGILHTDRGLVFITSEQFVSYTPTYHTEARLYTLRLLTDDGNIREIGKFQQYETLRQARKAAKDYANFVHSLP